MRDGTKVFEETYSDIPSYRDAPDENSNVRLIRDKWEPSQGVYTIEYTISDGEEWNSAQIEREETDVIGVDLHIMGGGMTAKQVSVNVLEFESEHQVQSFLHDIDG
ncbi:hypothetical protein ACLI4Y_06820 [Natrialbaceae archaeon A-CW3]